MLRGGPSWLGAAARMVFSSDIFFIPIMAIVGALIGYLLIFVCGIFTSNLATSYAPAAALGWILAAGLIAASRLRLRETRWRRDGLLRALSAGEPSPDADRERQALDVFHRLVADAAHTDFVETAWLACLASLTLHDAERAIAVLWRKGLIEQKITGEKGHRQEHDGYRITDVGMQLFRSERGWHGSSDAQQAPHGTAEHTRGRRRQLQSQPPASVPTHVFVSYSRSDSEWLHRLHVHFKPLVRQGLVELWDDTKIPPGADWHTEIERAMTRSRIIILLVSADFLASDFVAYKELPRLLSKAAHDGARIVPVIVGHCLFQGHPILSRYQAVNSPQAPLMGMSRHEVEETFLKVVQAVVHYSPTSGLQVSNHNPV